MDPVVGIFPNRAVAEQAARKTLGFLGNRIQLLLPGSQNIESVVPTDEAESPGVGQAVGGVVGAATGASAGFGLGAVTALLVPGIGAVTAVGMAAAALFGAVGAAGGAAAGAALEEDSRTGLPRDEIYLYEGALAAGKGVLFAMVENEKEAEQVRQAFSVAGAESLDAARRQWWIGLREAESTGATGARADAPQTAYGKGFLAALQPDLDQRMYNEALPILRKRFGDVALTEAFQRGYGRGAAAARARAEEIGVGERK